MLVRSSRHAARATTSSLLVVAALATGCGTTVARPPEAPRRASPLGSSFVLAPVPSDDDSLLGRIIVAAPEPGGSLDEVSAPNPCLDALEPTRTATMAGSFEDAEDISIAGSGSAVLGAYGFSADAAHATHFFYRVTTERRVARVDTVAYDACCKENDCGIGYVSALVYGSGEYAAAEETRAAGDLDFAIATVEGTAELKVLHRRSVRGWIAAAITPRERGRSIELGLLGSGIHETPPDEQVRAIYAGQSAEVVGGGPSWWFTVGGHRVTENEMAERFEAVVGSEELEERNRIPVAMAFLPIGLATSAVGATLFGIGAAEFATGPASAGFPAEMTAGALVFAAGVPMWGLATWYWQIDGGYDGQPTDHSITEERGRLLVERYNRQLLRRTIRNVRSGSAQTSRRAPDPTEPKLRVGLAGAGFRVDGSF